MPTGAAYVLMKLTMFNHNPLIASPFALALYCNTSAGYKAWQGVPHEGKSEEEDVDEADPNQAQSLCACAGARSR